MRIDIKDHDLSKAEEIAIIEKLNSFFRHTYTYLGRLFTDDFLGWVTNQIKDDIMPDLYGWGIGANVSLRETIENLKNINQNLAGEKSHLEVVIDTRAKLMNDLDERIVNQRIQKEELEEIIDKKANRIDAQELEITALKAKLYDLMSKGD